LTAVFQPGNSSAESSALGCAILSFMEPILALHAAGKGRGPLPQSA
jgi:hypothetical protein